MFAEGKGVPQDLEEAYAWLDIAAELCHPSAAEIRDGISSGLTDEARKRATDLASEYLPPYQRHCQYYAQ